MLRVPLLALGLVAVGVAYPLVTGTQSVTAWIPAMLGGALLLLGLWQHRAARVVSMLVALVGIVAPVMRLAKGSLDLAQPAQQALLLTAVLCTLVLLTLARRPGPRA